jgi:hypothetical protein
MSQGDRMNTVIMVRERLSFRPSPDKGRTGGVCGGWNQLFRMIYRPKTPLIPPLSGGKWVGDRD